MATDLVHTDDSRPTWLLLGGTAVVALGALLPWATVNAGFVTATKAGTDGDGVITLILSLVIGGLALAKWKAGLGRGVLITSLVVGLIILAIAIYDAMDVASSTKETEFVTVRASVGIGLWLTILGALAIAVGSIWRLRSGSGATASAGSAAWDPGLAAPPHPPAPPSSFAGQPPVQPPAASEPTTPPPA